MRYIIGLLILISLASCTTDIHKEDEVLKRIQGTWVGYDHNDGIYTHYKLIISGDQFNGWFVAAYTNDEPTWSSEPNEIGTITLSPVQGYTNATSKYRNINFRKANGEISLITEALTHMIIYDGSNGLYVSQWAPMTSISDEQIRLPRNPIVNITQSNNTSTVENDKPINLDTSAFLSLNDRDDFPEGIYIITSDKSYFYDDFDENKMRKAYLIKGDTVYLSKHEGSFGLCKYTSKTGKVTEGYIKLLDLQNVTNY